MIAFLEGKLIEALPTRAVVDVGGVGYEVLIPVSTFEKLPTPGMPVRIFTHLSVREDAHVLYGFATVQERDLFRLLIGTVTGIGPKLALNILSTMPPEAFRSAVSTGDTRALAQIPGVGKKTAERIVVELRDKMGAVPKGELAKPVVGLQSDQRVADAVLALMALDYKQAEAHAMVTRALAVLGQDATVEQLVRESLKQR